MKTDRQIQNDVIAQLEYDPSVVSENIGVSVKDGVVTLNGYVPNYSEKYAAERAAFRVEGVKAVVEEIQVRLPSSSVKTDADIALLAVNALKGRSNIPQGIQVSVEDGRITLRGDVDWDYQRESAINAVRYSVQENVF
jgi:osmotically-inducible protein OsmY